MIHPAALSALPGLPMPGEAVPVQAGDGLEPADFGALLAIEAGGISLPEQAVQPPLAALPSLPPPLPDAAVLPEGGKTLPLALPVAVSAETPAPELLSLPTASVVADPLLAAPIAPVEILPRALLRALLETTPIRPGRAAPPVPVSEPAAKPESDIGEAPGPTELLIPELSSHPLATPPGLVAPALALATATAPLEVPSPAPLRPPPVMPNQIHQTPPTPLAQAEPGEQPATPAQPATAPITLSVVTAAIVPAPRIGEPQVRLTLPPQVAARAAEPPKSPEIAPSSPSPLAVTAERRPAPGKAALFAPSDLALPLAEPIAPSAAIATPTIPTVPAPSAFAPADPALRPHDFTQLVDRLVGARELAAPQSFQLALQHGEFGQVQLRFSREGEGLNITMSSTDPEFARVVSAAPPPVLAPLPTETATPGGQRFEGQPQTGASTGNPAQHRSASPERRDDRHGPEGNPAPARNTDARGSRRSGIFA